MHAFIYFNCASSTCIIRLSDTLFPLNQFKESLNWPLKKTKITPISVNGSRDVSFPETYNPMVCEICNGTEAELYILHVKGIFSVWLNFIIACMQSYTKLLYMILTFLSLYIYRGRNCGMYSLKLELVIEDFTLKNNKSRKG